MAFAQVRHVRVGAHDVAYREEGNGPPVVLVHGWPLSSLTWRKVVPDLGRSFRCIAPDLLGAGLTRPGAARSLALGAQAELVVGLADALGLERFGLVGHDSGGSVARGAAVAMPERVSHLVLADTEVPGHRPWLVVALQAIGRLPGAAALLGRSLGSRRFCRSPLGFGTAFADLRRFDFDEFHATLLAPLSTSPAAAQACHRFLRDFDFADVDRLRAKYETLRMPTLVLWGERDTFFPLSEGRRLAAMLPAPTRFVSVSDAGLLVHEERPEVWIRAVRDLLSDDVGSAAELG